MQFVYNLREARSPRFETQKGVSIKLFVYLYSLFVVFVTRWKLDELAIKIKISVMLMGFVWTISQLSLDGSYFPSACRNSIYKGTFDRYTFILSFILSLSLKTLCLKQRKT